MSAHHTFFTYDAHRTVAVARDSFHRLTILSRAFNNTRAATHTLLYQSITHAVSNSVKSYPRDGPIVSMIGRS
jgi:hypothetical protein